ncbi:MAG: phosphatase [Bernardetiaceae bacterium]
MLEATHRLAVIDIGSNAIRLQISHVHPHQQYPRFKRLEYVRFPLRLGDEVFEHRIIGPDSIQQFLDLMQAYKILMRLYGVEDYMACATSAMREAQNAPEVVQAVWQQHQIRIEIISGQRESEILGKSIEHLTFAGAYMHVDVGGGSTEINFYEDGQKLSGRSFPLGGVRQLRDRAAAESVRLEMFQWIRRQSLRLSKIPKGIGTGGNINKLHGLITGKEANTVSFKALKDTHQKIAELPYQKRISTFDLNTDRADVIVTAGDIYLQTMEIAKVKKVIIPHLGLREGMLRLLLERNQIPVKIP